MLVLEIFSSSGMHTNWRYRDVYRHPWTEWLESDGKINHSNSLY